jgi:hypothetical protein
MKARKISWDRQAINYFGEAIRYIRKESPQKKDLKFTHPTNTKSIILAIIGRSNCTVYVSAIW